MGRNDRVRVRRARAGDVAVLFRMKQALTRDDGNEGVLRARESDWARDGFGAKARFSAVVAEADGKVVGMATFSEAYMTALGGAVFSIQDLYVEPGQRRRGVGRALVAEVGAIALSQGVPLIQLNVMENNAAAREFYRRLGFQHLAECLTYVLGGSPMVFLARPVPQPQLATVKT